MKCDEIDYQILGQSMQMVEVELDPNEAVIAEAGAMNYMENRTGWDMNRDGHVGQPIPPNMIPYQQYQQQQQMPMPAQAGGYINPNTGELLEAEQGPHIDKIAKKGKNSG